MRLKVLSFIAFFMVHQNILLASSSDEDPLNMDELAKALPPPVNLANQQPLNNNEGGLNPLDLVQNVPQQDENDIYELQEFVSKKYLGFDETTNQYFRKPVYDVIWRKIRDRYNLFQTHYTKFLNGKRAFLDGLSIVTLDITNFSSRARIMLLTRILNHQIENLPYSFAIPNDPNFAKMLMCFENARTNPTIAYYYNWEAEDFRAWKRGNVALGELVSRTTITFQIGNYHYPFENGVTRHQKGSGRLYILPNNACTYPKIYGKIQTYGNLLGECSTLLRQQKRNGGSIQPGDLPGHLINNNQEARFLNGFNLLLDYEVARRIVVYNNSQVGSFEDHPMVTYLSYLIEHMPNAQANTNDYKSLYIPDYGYKGSSLFTEKLRKQVAQDIINGHLIDQGQPITKRTIRDSMLLNAEDENSGDPIYDEESNDSDYD